MKRNSKIRISQAKIKIQNNLSNTFYRAVCILALFLLTIIFVPSGNSHASQAEKDQIQNKINEANKGLSSKQSESKTLGGEVGMFDGQISTVQSQINDTQSKIDSLNAQINDANKKISEHEVDLKKKKESLNEYLKVLYEESNVSIIELIAASKNFSDFVDRTEYNLTMQEKIKNTTREIKNLKQDLEDKKVKIAQNIKEIEVLKNQQVAQRQGLAVQRGSKQALLNITKGQESEYKKVIQNLQKEYKKADSDMWAGTTTTTTKSGDGGGTTVTVSDGPIKKGDTIGLMGNTGFSSGAHIHFEFKNSSGTRVDPASVLDGARYVTPVTNYTITQGCWGDFSHAGAGGPCAIDYVTFKSPPIVRAVASGAIIKRVTGQVNTYQRYFDCLNNGWGNCGQYITYGNYIILQHDDGTQSLYAHLQ